MQIFLRKYGVSGTADFDLLTTDGTSFLTSAIFTSGCSFLNIDGGTSATTVNLPILTQNGFKINFSVSELTSKRLHVKFVDPQWLSHSFVVETYGTSASQHSDLASGLLQNLIDTIPLQDLLKELISIATGNITKNGDNYSYYDRSGLNIVANLSAAPGNRVRN